MTEAVRALAVSTRNLTQSGVQTDDDHSMSIQLRFNSLRRSTKISGNTNINFRPIVFIKL